MENELHPFNRYNLHFETCMHLETIDTFKLQNISFLHPSFPHLPFQSIPPSIQTTNQPIYFCCYKFVCIF